MVYEWDPATFIKTKVSAQLVGQTLEAIGRERGVAAARALVEAARPDDSPLHDLPITWDVARAALNYQVEEARHIIRAIVIREPDGELSKAPAFVHVTLRDNDDKQDGYVRLMIAMGIPDWQQQVRNEAKSAMISLRNRYSHIEEFATVWQAIETVTREPALV